MNLPFIKKKEERPERIFEQDVIVAKDIIAPGSIKMDSEYLDVGGRLAVSFFVFSYPRYLTAAWLAPVINMGVPMDIAMFIHPVDVGLVLRQLRRKVTEVESELMERSERGLVRDPVLEVAFRDLEELRDRLQTAQDKMFRLGVYINVYGETQEEMLRVKTELRSILESRLIYLKPALYRQKDGFNSALPYGKDLLLAHTTMNTEPLSSIFPFVSFDLSSNEGILYGLNMHNNSLILFDRFSLENANEVIFAKSGAGKSYAVKLEILRSLMTGIDVIVLDPENEYKPLAEAVGGSFFDISLSSPSHINPFDLPLPREDELPADVLRSNIINLVGLMRIMLGGLTPEEDAIMDRAIAETYAAKDITPESTPVNWQNNIPLMEDLESVLAGMEGAESLVRRLQKFTKGTYAVFFNQPTNIATDKAMIAFGIRDMEDGLRPMAMYVIMRYIWNKVRSVFKKRILVVDEAWWLMQSEEGASFLFGIAKRARKYYLGVTTITQDVGDFMKSDYGRPIIANSSIQTLMKQSPATIDLVQQSFNLTEAERDMLLETGIGEGIFFAGAKHVAMRVVASPTEHQIITTAPQEILERLEAKRKAAES